MIYELKADCFFSDKEEMEKMLEKMEKYEDSMITINEGSPDVEVSFIQTLENHHDVNPNEPCKGLTFWCTAG